MSSEQAPANASTDEVIMPSSLTAENGAKALLIGEFSETVEVRNELYCGCGYCDFCEENPDEPETCQISVPVSWNTIKAIYAKAVQHLSKPLPTDRDDPLRCPECGSCEREEFTDEWDLCLVCDALIAPV